MPPAARSDSQRDCPARQHFHLHPIRVPRCPWQPYAAAHCTPHAHHEQCRSEVRPSAMPRNDYTLRAHKDPSSCPTIPDRLTEDTGASAMSGERAGHHVTETSIQIIGVLRVPTTHQTRVSTRRIIFIHNTCSYDMPYPYVFVRVPTRRGRGERSRWSTHESERDY